MKRISVVPALAALLLAAAGSAQGAPPPGTPSSPEEAQALAAAAPDHAAQASVRRASVGEARAAAQQPGAVTEGSLDTEAPSVLGARSLARATATYCWSGQVSMQWGTWPYDQHVYDHTYWCAVYGSYITYRSTNVTHGSNLCSGSGDYSFRISGGVGYSSVTIEAGAYFNCPTTIPWININRHDWLHDKYTAWGGISAVDWS
jgi:hypothetical protein